MKAVQVSIEIQAAPEAVFNVFADLERAAERITDIIKLEMLSEGPVGVGSRWRETRVVFNKEATEEMEITVFDPPNGYSVEAESHGSHYKTEFVFSPKGDGTEVTMTFEATPISFMAKVMGFFMGPMMRNMISKCVAKDMTDLKRVLEQGEAEAAAT